MDKDGYISNGELFQVLKMMVGNNLKDTQLQQIVDKTIIHADTDGDGKISFEEFCAVSKLYGFFKYLFLVCVLDVEKQFNTISIYLSLHLHFVGSLKHQSLKK